MINKREIDAVINKAKQDRADYIASKLDGSSLPLAVTLATAACIAFVAYTCGPSEAPTAERPVAEFATHSE